MNDCSVLFLNPGVHYIVTARRRWWGEGGYQPKPNSYLLSNQVIAVFFCSFWRALSKCVLGIHVRQLMCSCSEQHCRGQGNGCQCNVIINNYFVGKFTSIVVLFSGGLTHGLGPSAKCMNGSKTAQSMEWQRGMMKFEPGFFFFF